MSMKDNPGSGYVMPAEDVIRMLPEELRERATELLEDNDWEALHDFFEENLPPGIPRPEETFRFGDEDTSDDLESGKVYVRWDESDLFTRQEKPCMVEMRDLLRKAGREIEPTLCNWAIFG